MKMANNSAIWQHAAHITTNCYLLAAEQESYQTAYLLTKTLKNFLKNSQKNGPVRRRRKKDTIERDTAGGRTRQEIAK